MDAAFEKMLDPISMVSAQRKAEEAKQHSQNCWIPLKEA